MTDQPAPHVHPRQDENDRARAFDEEVRERFRQAEQEKRWAFCKWAIERGVYTDEVNDAG